MPELPEQFTIPSQPGPTYADMRPPPIIRQPLYAEPPYIERAVLPPDTSSPTWVRSMLTKEGKLSPLARTSLFLGATVGALSLVAFGVYLAERY